jgi:hypothetical protein
MTKAVLLFSRSVEPFSRLASFVTGNPNPRILSHNKVMCELLVSYINRILLHKEVVPYTVLD